MLRVVIVDDEPLVRKRLRTIINWEELNYSIVAEACDGEEALAQIEILKPDLLITDIRMPVINGLQLIKKVKSILQDIQVVILSGYGDFEYAHEAMQFGVKNYLLKPLDEEELIAILKTIQLEIQEKRTILHKINAGNKALTEKWVMDAFHNRNHHSIGEKAIEIGLELSLKTFAVLIIELDNYEHALLEDSDGEIQIKYLMVQNAIDEIVNADSAGFLVSESVNRYNLLYIGNKESGSNQLQKQVAEKICSYMDKYLKLTVTVGYSEIVEEPSAIPACYKEAKTALEGKFILGSNRVIGLEDVIRKPEGNAWELIFGWDGTGLQQAIEQAQFRSIQDETNILFDRIEKGKISPEFVNGIIIQNMMGIGRTVKKAQGDFEQIVGEDFQIEGYLKNVSTLKEIQEWFTGICIKSAEYLARLRKNRPTKISKEIIEYINKNYFEEITLKKISGVVYMNPVYLGQVFKNETGVNFNDCLTEIRINNAIKLLLETDIPVYEISEKVGYQAPSNFYKAFKKLTGLNPVNYRQRAKGE